MQKKSHIRVRNSSLIMAALVLGAVLGVGGSVFATSIGNSITTSTDLTVTGNTGLGTTTPGMVLGVQGVGSFASTGSTIYSTLTMPSFTATSTSASNSIGTTTPGSTLSIQGVANFVSGATSTLYTDFSLRSISATSTIYGANGTAAVPSFSFFSDPDVGIFRGAANVLGFATGGSEYARIDASGNVGIGTTTVGSILSVQGVANFTAGTSTIYSAISVPNMAATTTTATSTFAGGAIIASGAGALGVASTSPMKTLSVGGSAQFGNSTGTTTISASAKASGVGSCIELRAASSSEMYRIYLGTVSANGGAVPLVVEKGSCGAQAWAQ